MRTKREACRRCGHIVPGNRLKDGICEDRQRCDQFIRRFGKKASTQAPLLSARFPMGGGR